MPQAVYMVVRGQPCLDGCARRLLARQRFAAQSPASDGLRALQVFADVFEVIPRDAARVPASRQCPLTHDSAAAFTLLENDFTFGGQKVAGNAQAISHRRWLQHTSFLWDFQRERMQLLQEPAKRPKYRGEREHGSFLTPLVSLGFRRNDFVEGIEDSLASRGFELQPAGAFWPALRREKYSSEAAQAVQAGVCMDAPARDAHSVALGASSLVSRKPSAQEPVYVESLPCRLK